MQNRTVLISGASIAGPALAHWLRRYEFTPTVVERAPALRTGGYKIDLRGVAVTVAQRSGILDEVRRHASDVRGATFVDSSGRRVADLDADFVQGREGDDLEIMRGKLSRILYDAIRDDVEGLFGDSITGLRQDADGVDVRFEHAPPRRFDLVVGADGLHSNVRALTFGPEARFRRDLGYYISIFSTPNVLDLDRWELFHTLPGRLANTYAARGDDQAKALFFFASPPLQLDRHDVAAQQEVLSRAFADAGWEVPRLLDTMRDAPDFYFDSTSQIVMDCWSDRRVVLLGDAAYCPSPASGQGASTALVGAYLLAGELAAAHGDHRTAFAYYESRMRPFASANQEFARAAAGQIAPATPRAVRWRYRMLRLLPYLPWKGLVTGAIRRKIRQAANAIALPDYPGTVTPHGGSTAASTSEHPMSAHGSNSRQNGCPAKSA